LCQQIATSNGNCKGKGKGNGKGKSEDVVSQYVIRASEVVLFKVRIAAKDLGELEKRFAQLFAMSYMIEQAITDGEERERMLSELNAELCSRLRGLWEVGFEWYKPLREKSSTTPSTTSTPSIATPPQDAVPSQSSTA